jgi:1-acyl-sn-glycerol-3-phosphate acyltransferase
MAKDRSRKTHAPMWLHRVLRWSLGPYFVWRYRPTTEHQEVVDQLRPPYIVIPNHVMTFDPAIVNYFIPGPIHYVASDANFRNPIFSFLLRQLGAIATSKQADDMASLRFMLKTLKRGKVIGIFAEGQRSWDGVSLPVIPSTGKLVKIAKVPVLVSLLKGGYMTIPRWSFHTRRGRMVVEQKLAVTAEEVAKLSVDEITARIEGAMAHDDSEYQNEKRVAYVSKRPAESLQLALFYCPSCSSLNTMNSSGRRFFCESCGYEVEFTQFYRFRSVGGSEAPPLHFTTIREWSVAQNKFLEGYLRNAVNAGGPGEIFADDNALMLTGYRLARLRRRGLGRLSFHLDGIRFNRSEDSRRGRRVGARDVRFGGSAERFFPWDEVTALNVVYQDQLEFYHQKSLYVFRFPSHNTSAYKYDLCGRMLAAVRTAAAD